MEIQTFAATWTLKRCHSTTSSLRYGEGIASNSTSDIFSMINLTRTIFRPGPPALKSDLFFSSLVAAVRQRCVYPWPISRFVPIFGGIRILSNRHKAAIVVFSLLLVSSFAQRTWAQESEAPAWAADLPNQYRIWPDITYLTANNYNSKLDLYIRNDLKAPAPTLIYIHGGGWIFGTKETSVLMLLPYMEMGWNIVNVEYRMASVSLAPAAVEDCRCALQWVIRNAKQYNIDTNKLVVTGHSAGGHLALTTGMLPASAGLDRQCYGPEDLKVAAIVNWYGISDVNDLLEGPNLKNYAVMWLGSQTNRDEIAKRVSPLTYVRAGLPPIITIHGDADPVVPYSQSVRLHKALDKVGVTNKLVTIKGGEHGNFNRTDTVNAYAAIKEFLKKQGIGK
jgi:acetyl esterase/lipase